jgi:hypothetical protein
MSRAASFTKAEICRVVDAAVESACRKTGEKLAAAVDFRPDRSFRVLIVPASSVALTDREDGAGWEDVDRAA